MLAAGCAPGVPLVWAASGASRPQQAEHVPVPLARRDRSPPTLACGGTCAGRGICVCRFRRVAFAASRARPRAARAARPLYAGHGCGEICARRATCVGCIRRVASAASRARPRANRAARPIPAFNGLWRDVRRARHLCVPHSARRDRSEPSTSSCRSAARSLFASHGDGEMCAGRGTCVCRIRRVATAASRARPRANRAARQIPAYHGLRRDVR